MPDERDRCVFCEIVAGREAASVVYRDELVCAFMDIQPVNAGHLLVIPLVHAPHVSDLGAALGGRMFNVAQRLAAAIHNSGVRCEGINFFLADGIAAGQEVFHAHLHVFPRFSGDGFGLRHPPEYHSLPDRITLDAIANAIRTAPANAPVA
ncbi:MAG: HIT family protein [Betaproteobacteria bacterium]